ncbi:unnamed protein product [Lathyrus oleraceus]
MQPWLRDFGSNTVVTRRWFRSPNSVAVIMESLISFVGYSGLELSFSATTLLIVFQLVFVFNCDYDGFN